MDEYTRLRAHLRRLARQTPQGQPLSRSYWKVQLAQGRVLAEHPAVSDTLLLGQQRALDWTLDIVATGDVRNIEQVFLIAPDRQRYSLPIRPGTAAFQFKIGTMQGGARPGDDPMQCQIIGRVENAQGDCTCLIWDRQVGVLQYQSNVTRFGSWRPGILPSGPLALDVLGIDLAHLA